MSFVRHRRAAGTKAFSRSFMPVYPPSEHISTMHKLIRFAAAAPALLILSVLGTSAPRVAQGAEFDHSHAGLTQVYEAVLKEGLVDYAGLREKPKALDAYLAGVAATTPEQHAAWSRDQRFAFWINAYNAFTLQLLRDNGPVKSIKDLGGFFSSPWEKKFIPMPAFDPEKKSKNITLDEIEHELLRPVFKDARVHAAVNCASMGCPPLRATAFTADGLGDQLDDQVAVWLSDSTRNQVTPQGGKIRVSKIFDWFEKDFGKNDAAVARWIGDHVGDEAKGKALRDQARSIDVKYLDYDWGINAQKGRR
ncbi:MAG: hypothetical protein ACJA2W_001449 [Planctomycetota bacterium]|jgi:hypothetical protein